MTDYREAYRRACEVEGFANAITCLALHAALCRGLLPPEGPDPTGARWQLLRVAWALDAAAGLLASCQPRLYAPEPPPP